jgi:hypothetical protein
VQFNGPTAQLQVAPPGETVTVYAVIELLPEIVGADQPIVTELSCALTPVTEGAPGESPKVRALFSVTAPALVVTVTPTVPPTGADGLVKVKVVPSALSFQDETAVAPTEIPVTPTKKEPLIVTVAPPVFGIWERSTLDSEGF